MAAAFVIILTISAAAAWIDRAITRDNADRLRASTRRIYAGLKSRENRLVADVHHLYCEFFDRVYGSRTWSLQRFVVSVLSTTIAFVSIVVAIGPAETILGDIWEMGLDPVASNKGRWGFAGVLGVYVLLVFVGNIVPDFFSLSETRMVLRWAEGKGPLGVGVLAVVDVLLTTVIFLMIPTIGIALMMLLGGPEVAGYLIGDVRRLLSHRVFLPFLLTTYVTSALWVLFMATFAVIRFVARFRPSFLEVIEEFNASEQPTLSLDRKSVV